MYYYSTANIRINLRITNEKRIFCASGNKKNQETTVARVAVFQTNPSGKAQKIQTTSM